MGWRRLADLVVAVVASLAGDRRLGSGHTDLVRGTVLSERDMLQSKTGEQAKVVVLQDVLVSCKGQVFDRRTGQAADKPTGPWGSGQSRVFFDGCGYMDGTCVWDSDAGHITRKPYCVKTGPGPGDKVCVPHGPGPGEVDTQDCRERTIDFCPNVSAGPLDVVVVLTQPQWGAYFHFLIDSLSRVAWMWQQHPEVVTDSHTTFHTGKIDEVAQEWARLAGIHTSAGDENRLLDGWWQAKTAYFPPSNMCMNKGKGSEPFAVQQLRTLITSKLESPPNDGHVPSAVIFERDPRKSQNRAILNHAEILEVVKAGLPAWSVDVISDYPDTPMPQEICSRVHKADIVMGPHGAGFANLVCASQGTVLLEFQQGDHSWDFEKLSLKLGLPYVGLQVPGMIHYGSGTVDLVALRHALGRAVNMSRYKELTTTLATRAKAEAGAPAGAQLSGAEVAPERSKGQQEEAAKRESAAEAAAGAEAAKRESAAEAPGEEGGGAARGAEGEPASEDGEKTSATASEVAGGAKPEQAQDAAGEGDAADAALEAAAKDVAHEEEEEEEEEEEDGREEDEGEDEEKDAEEEARAALRHGADLARDGPAAPPGSNNFASGFVAGSASALASVALGAVLWQRCLSCAAAAGWKAGAAVDATAQVIGASAAGPAGGYRLPSASCVDDGL